jgi:uncharacterized membrane protein
VTKGKSLKVTVALAVILFAAGALRLYDIGGESIWYDEAHTVRDARQPLGKIITKVPKRDFHPPLYFLMMHGWVRLAGDSEAAVRLPSAAFGVAALLVLFFVGRELRDESLGLAAVYLSSFSYFFIRYSQEARTYTLLLLLSLASYYFFIRLIRRGETLKALAAYLACTILLLYTHYHAVFLILAQASTVALLLPRLKKRALGYIAAIALAAAAFSPWIPTIRDQLRLVSTWSWWIPAPTTQHLLIVLRQWIAAPHPFYLGRIPLVPYLLASLMGVLVFVGFLAWPEGRPSKGVRGWPLPAGWASREETVILALWLLVPVLAPLAYSKVGRSIFMPRYMIGAAPAFYLLAARGVLALKRPRLAAGLCLLILALSVPGLKSYYSLPEKDEWNKVARFTESQARRGDMVVLSSIILNTPFTHYYKGALDIHGVKSWRDLGEISKPLKKAMAGHRRIWFVRNWDGDEKAFKALNDLLPQGHETEHLFNGIKVLLYTIPPELGAGPL